MKHLFMLIILFVSGSTIAQDLIYIPEQKAPSDYENIHIKRLFGDSLSTSFIIWIKDTVATHKHEAHSETIYVLEGEAKFYFNDSIKIIQADDVLFIPKNNWHAVKVTSEIPMKVISVQSPGFYGEDRIFRGY
jgi:mannose-6-phosphate isomerase-like protein (cupin superfamily)